MSPIIWKIPAGGGQPIQVTKNGGFRSQESPDGKYLYFTKPMGQGIWRVQVAGGEETLVIRDFDPALADYWQVVSDGIYFVDASSSPYPTIKFLSLIARKRSPIAMMAGPVFPWAGGLSVSPDRRSIVYSQKTYQSSEIFLADNFR